ncbi:MAG: hypothetical protein ACR2PR_00625 [Pseudohongiellaceae bacterium]
MIDNKWRGRSTDTIMLLPPLPPYPQGYTGCMFQTLTLDPAVGDEVCLLLLEESEYAHEISNNAGMLRVANRIVSTSAGDIAVLLWHLQVIGADSSHYEHPLNIFHDDTLKMLEKIAQQRYLKLLVIDSDSVEAGSMVKVASLKDIKNVFEMGDLAAMLRELVPHLDVADFSATQAALNQEFSIEDLIISTTQPED